MTTDAHPLPGLALARGNLDRSAHERAAPDLVARALGDPSTVVAALRRDTMEVAGGALVLRGPEPADEQRLVVFLGRGAARAAEPDRTAYLGVIEPQEPDPGWQTLRQAGPLLSDLDAAVFATTLALANWHRSHGYCARCGAASEPALGGWVRRCPSCAAEHFPRTDSAVIVSVIDDAERLLLGRGLTWPPDQYSVLAGFVEPGESLEAAVAREVAEESGVHVTDVRYLGSQPWPFPSSIMVGVTARAVTTSLRADPDELADVRWVTREEYSHLLRARAIRVPGGISIAKRLIERWLGTTVEQAAGGEVIEGFRPS